MGVVLKEMIARNYYAGYCSCSFLLCMIFSLVVLVVPFFLAASTHGFWNSSLIHREQPIVLYNNEIVLTTLTSTKTVSDSTIVTALNSNFFSTIGWLNDLHGSSLSPVDVYSTGIDTNADQKLDLYTFNFTLYNQQDSIRNLRLFVEFEYKLRERLNLEMTGLALANIDLPYGASEVYIDGTLRLKQKNPLKSSKAVRKEYNSSVFVDDKPIDGFWNRVLLRYWNRNETLDYDFVYSSKTPSNKKGVKVNMVVRVPVYEDVVYQPLFLQNLKFAWIQYLSLAIPIWVIVSSFAHYVYSQQIFETTIKIRE